VKRDYLACACENRKAGSQCIGVAVQPIVAQAYNLALMFRGTKCSSGCWRAPRHLPTTDQSRKQLSGSQLLIEGFSWSKLSHFCILLASCDTSNDRSSLQIIEVGRECGKLGLCQALRNRCHRGCSVVFRRSLTALLAPIGQFLHDVWIELTC
jgi:hypothetical protein